MVGDFHSFGIFVDRRHKLFGAQRPKLSETMTSFTTLVNIDANTGSKLAKFISSKLAAEEAEGFVKQQEAFFAGKKTKESIELFLSKLDVILGLPSDQGATCGHPRVIVDLIHSHPPVACLLYLFRLSIVETEAVFQSLFSILYILGDESTENPAIVQSIISTLTSDATNSPRRRLNALLQFFNLALGVNTKYELLLGKWRVCLVWCRGAGDNRELLMSWYSYFHIRQGQRPATEDLHTARESERVGELLGLGRDAATGVAPNDRDDLFRSGTKEARLGHHSAVFEELG